jgi:hypothetical protein
MKTIITIFLSALQVMCFLTDVFSSDNSMLFNITAMTGSEQMVKSSANGFSGIAVYRNSKSIDANYEYYESFLTSKGWKKISQSAEITSTAGAPVIMMIKDRYFCCICFYKDSDNMTCAMFIMK